MTTRARAELRRREAHVHAHVGGVVADAASMTAGSVLAAAALVTASPVCAALACAALTAPVWRRCR